MQRKLLSILTPTWGRPEHIVKCIDRVQAQTYPNLEHIIVIDGTDRELGGIIVEASRKYYGLPGSPKRRVEYLGFNTSTYLHNSFGVGPLTVAALMASGEYQMWLCDDEQMTPDHIEKLVNLLEEQEVDFTYSKTRLVQDTPEGPWVYDVGQVPPRHGTITNFVYRRELLRRGMFRFHRPIEGDWDAVEQWISQGATCAMLDEVTFIHHVDHRGEHHSGSS